MTDKERDGAKLLLMMNAVQYLVLNIPPHNDRLDIDTTLIPDLRQTMSNGMLSKDPSVICAFALAGYYTGALEPKGLGAQTRPDNPFLTVYDKIGAALYHIEVWHNGKCVGIRDGQIGTGFIAAPCKDWFVPGRNPQYIRY